MWGIGRSGDRKNICVWADASADKGKIVTKTTKSTTKAIVFEISGGKSMACTWKSLHESCCTESFKEMVADETWDHTNPQILKKFTGKRKFIIYFS